LSAAGALNCCSRDIRAAAQACSSKGYAPCVLGAATAPTTPTTGTAPATTLCGDTGVTGILESEFKDVCCPTECGTCGKSLLLCSQCLLGSLRCYISATAVIDVPLALYLYRVFAAICVFGSVSQVALTVTQGQVAGPIAAGSLS
jgi:hypothetical protein